MPLYYSDKSNISSFNYSTGSAKSPIKELYYSDGSNKTPIWKSNYVVDYTYESVTTGFTSWKAHYQNILPGGHIGGKALIMAGSFTSGFGNINWNVIDTSLTITHSYLPSSSDWIPSFVNGASGSSSTGVVYAGGKNNSFERADALYVNSSVVYTRISDLGTARSMLSGTFLGNYYIFAGGWTQNSSTNSIYYKLSQTNATDAYSTSYVKTTIATLNQSRDLPAVSRIGGKVLFSGGNTGTTIGSNVVPSSMIDIYDSITLTHSVASLPTGVAYAAGGATKDFGIVFGGRYSTSMATKMYGYNRSLVVTENSIVSPMSWSSTMDDTEHNLMIVAQGFANVTNDSVYYMSIWVYNNLTESTGAMSFNDNYGIRPQVEPIGNYEYVVMGTGAGPYGGNQNYLGAGNNHTPAVYKPVKS